jgi:MYXO-CTERM domain-containing protein
MAFACVCGIAHAHTNIPAPATFTSPPRLAFAASDAGDVDYAPYPFPTADTSFDVAWEDGDLDPTGRHYFYYLDHAPPLALSMTDIKAMATPIPETSGGIWASCDCPADFGACPDAGVRDCRNAFTWDTHLVPDGAYFLIAVTVDPPYDVYTVSDGPVRVTHGSGQPPGVVVVRPDGFGTFDQSYRLRWLLAGTPPFHVDLAYDDDDDVRTGAPFTTIVTDLSPAAGVDATFLYDWDVSKLPSAHIYYARATVRDAAGSSVYTMSRAGVTVYHPGDMPDLGGHRSDMATGHADDGCGCALGGAGDETRGARAMLLALLSMVLLARRRRSRA